MPILLYEPFLQTRILAKIYMYKTFSNGTCHLTTAQYKTASVNYVMASTKNSPYSFPLFKAYATFKKDIT